MALRGKAIAVLIAAAVVFVLLALALGGGGNQGNDASRGQQAGGEGGSEALDGLSEGSPGGGQDVGLEREEQQPTAIENLYIFDASDTRQLAGYSQAVFSGEVLRLVGEEPLKSTIPGDEGDPRQQWEVEISEVLKGEGLGNPPVSPGARVVVNVDGGTDPETGEPVVVASAGETPSAVDQLVEEGGSYVFAVRLNEREGWLDVSAQPFGKVPVESREEYERVRADFVRGIENQVNPLEGQVVSD